MTSDLFQKVIYQEIREGDESLNIICDFITGGKCVIHLGSLQYQAQSHCWSYRAPESIHDSNRMNGKEIFKARYVAKGFTQKFGIDYTETYSAVLTYTSLRLIISIASKNNWEMLQKYFRTAYLNADLLEPIYMTQPEGFIQPGKENKICILNKALYGLKQAGRAWQQILFKTLKIGNLQQSKNEPCIWFRKSNELMIIIGVYVDDFIITGNDATKIQEIDRILHKNYNMKDVGNARQFLGIEIINQESKRMITQRSYIKELLRKFKQTDCKAESTPGSGTEFSGTKTETEYPIREALGGLMFIANATRPDIAYMVNKLSRNVSTPTKALWRGVQHVLKYLKGTSDYGLSYGSRNYKITCYADSSFADDPTDRKSTTGWIFLLGNDLISWQSTKQKSVALSTTESEYMACCDAAKEAVWMKNLIEEILQVKQEPVSILQDNQGTIFISNNSINNRRTKHIDVRYHFVREQIQGKMIAIQYCETSLMTADILTKPLGKNIFQFHRNALLKKIQDKEDLDHKMLKSKGRINKKATSPSRPADSH